MSTRSKTSNTRRRNTSVASYQAYYGITLIETLMSVGLLGVVLIPLLMLSTAYLSTKLLKNRTSTELSQNVNTLTTEMSSLASISTGVDFLASDRNHVVFRAKGADGASKIYDYRLIGSAGAQRLRKTQGVSNNGTVINSSSSALRSLNEDSTTITTATGFVYCNSTTCTAPANSTATNQAIARTAEVVVIDGNTASDVTIAAGVVSGVQPVGILYNAGDNSRKRTFLPNNVLPLGTDNISADANFRPTPDVPNSTLGGTGNTGGVGNVGTTNNPNPFGLIKVVTKQQAYGTTNADLTFTTGNGSTFTTLPSPANRITTPAASTQTILPNFKLDQTVADSFAGNVCFSGWNSGGVFQVYFWNRTMGQAALTSAQDINNTPECTGASPGYDTYNSDDGPYYIGTPTRKEWQAPKTTTKNGPTGYTSEFTTGTAMTSDDWPNWRSWSTADQGEPTTDSSRSYFSSGTAINGGTSFEFRYYRPVGLGSQTIPRFDANPIHIGIDVSDNHYINSADEAGTEQAQAQDVVDNGRYVLVHQRGNDVYETPSLTTIDPFGNNHARNIYKRRMKTFAVFGGEAGTNRGDCYNTAMSGGPTTQRIDDSGDYGLPGVGWGSNVSWSLCSKLQNRADNVDWWKTDPKNTTVTYYAKNDSFAGQTPASNWGYGESWVGGFYLSQRNQLLRTEAPTAIVRKYLNPNPTTTDNDIINSPASANAPFIMRDFFQNFLFYSATFLNGTTKLYGVNPDTGAFLSSGPDLNSNWGDIARTQLAAGKRVLSWSPHNKVVVTGNTDTTGAVVAWYYSSVNLPVADLKKGGMGFNAAQVNAPRINYIATPNSTNTYQNDIRAIATEGSTFYTVNAVTQRLTRYTTTNTATASYNRKSETPLNYGSGASAMAISPFDNGMYILNSSARTVDYYSSRIQGEGLTPSLSDVTTTLNTTGTLAGVYAGVLVDNFTAFEGLMAVPQNSYDNIAAYNELQACANSCSDIRVKEAAAYFVNNKAFVFDPMETMPGAYSANDDVFDKNQLIAYRNQQQALLTPTPTTTKTATYNATTQTASISFSVAQLPASNPTGIAVSRATGKVYVLDSQITTDNKLNIYVYDRFGTYLEPETLSFDVSNSQFANAGDRLVSQTGQVMRLTLDEKYSQFYVHVENNGRIYQFGVDKPL